jgi:hypothetical protein
MKLYANRHFRFANKSYDIAVIFHARSVGIEIISNRIVVRSLKILFQNL